MKGILRDLLESVVVGALVFILTITNLLSSFDYILKDKFYQEPRGVSSQIKIIAIDEKTLEELGPIGNWPRSYYADLIKMLNTYEDAKPAVIGFDIIFSGYHGEGNTPEAGDLEFAQVATDSGNVVVASQLEMSNVPSRNEDGLKEFPVTYIYQPYRELLEGVRVGYANVAQDSDSVVRRILLNQEFEGQKLTMFSQEIYYAFCESQGTQPNDITTDKYGRTLINYSGKPGDYEYISMVDVLNGKIDMRAFKNSIVLVGAYAAGMQDNFNVPNGGSDQMFGVEIHANIIQAFMQGRFSINANPVVYGLICGVIAMLLMLCFKRLKLVWSTLLLLAGMVGEVAFGVWFNNQGKVVSLVYFPLVLLLGFIYSLAIRYLFEKLRRKKVLNAFKKYVAPEIVEEISKKGDFTIKLGGENRDIACLFVDIRGFTTMSEVLEPEQVVEILNNYLNLTTQSIFKNKGTLDKFVGDATMAVFNSPFDLDDYVFRAVCAALDIVEGGAALEEKLQKEFGRSVGFGVGVHCGPAVVGNVGCDFRMDYTAIGDTVNTAARLEANAKKGQVLISDEVYRRLGDRIEVEEIGEIPLKGKSKGFVVYSVLSAKRS